MGGAGRRGAWGGSAVGGMGGAGRRGGVGGSAVGGIGGAGRRGGRGGWKECPVKVWYIA